MGSETRRATKETPGVALVLGCPGPGVEPGTQCGLPRYAREHCQQHYKQLLAKEELRPLGIRPWHTKRTSVRVVQVVGEVELPGGGEGIVIAVRGCRGPSNEQGEETCGLPVYAKELCSAHYRQRAKKKPLKPLRRRRKNLQGFEKWGCQWRSEESAEAVRALATDKGLELGRELGVREFIVLEMEKRAQARGFVPKKPPSGPTVERWACTWSSATHADAVAAMVRAVEEERGEPVSERGYFAEELELLAEQAGYLAPEGQHSSAARDTGAPAHKAGSARKARRPAGGGAS